MRRTNFRTLFNYTDMKVLFPVIHPYNKLKLSLSNRFPTGLSSEQTQLFAQNLRALKLFVKHSQTSSSSAEPHVYRHITQTHCTLRAAGALTSPTASFGRRSAARPPRAKVPGRTRAVTLSTPARTIVYGKMTRSRENGRLARAAAR